MLEPQTVKEASSQLVDTLVGLESNKYLECLEKKLRQHELIFLAPPAEGRRETVEPRESKDGSGQADSEQHRRVTIVMVPMVPVTC